MAAQAGTPPAAAEASRKRGRPQGRKETRRAADESSKKVKTVFHLPVALSRRARALASLNGETLQSMAERALDAYVSKELPRAQAAA